jgi:hypothetical protein
MAKGSGLEGMGTKVERAWLNPKRDPTARAPGRIVAKETVPYVRALAVIGDELVVGHHEGFQTSPGGVTVRRLAAFGVVRQTAGSFYPIIPLGDAWLTHGPLWAGRHASAHLLDPSTLECRLRLPVCAPFAVLDAHRFIAHTPALSLEGALEADPALVRESWIELPKPGGLVEIDLRRKQTKIVAPVRGHERFRAAVLSPGLDILYAATEFGRTVALRLADGVVVWERPGSDNVVKWSQHALALDPTGRLLATGGFSGVAPDLLLLDARTGEVQTQLTIRDFANRSRLSTARTNRVEALAFHPSGWLAASTNGGVVAEIRPSGEVSAFRAATRSVDALSFLDDGASLLVGGAERNLRVWPVDLP